MSDQQAPKHGEVWEGKTGRLWVVDTQCRFLRPGHVLMRPMGATGFGGAKAVQSAVEGFERRWRFYKSTRTGLIA